jgi:hypothetical protein
MGVTLGESLGVAVADMVEREEGKNYQKRL